MSDWGGVVLRKSSKLNYKRARNPVHKASRFVRTPNYKIVSRVPRTLRSKAVASNRCITIKRSEMTTLTATYNGVLTATGAAYSWTLSAIPSVSEFTSLYDQYRIRKIVMTFYPRYNSHGSNDYTATFTQIPSWVSAIDLDDSTTPTSANELLQYPGAKLHPWNRPFKRVIYPRSAMAMYSGAFTSYGSAPGKQWLDCASDGILYYGLKMYTTTYSSANNGDSPAWDVKIDYYVQFRGMR